MRRSCDEVESVSLVGDQLVQAGRRSQKCLTLMVSLRALLMFAWLVHELAYFDYSNCAYRSQKILLRIEARSESSLTHPDQPTSPLEVESPYETTTALPVTPTRDKLKRIIRRRKKPAQSGADEPSSKGVLEKTVNIVPLHASTLTDGSDGRTINTKTTWNRQVREFKPMGIHPISGRRWRIVRRKKVVKRSKEAGADSRSSELEQRELSHFESSAICVGRAVFDAWCAAHCLLATSPFIVGVWLRRRLPLLLHLALDALLTLLLLILCTIAACFVLLTLLLVREEARWQTIIHGLGFTTLLLTALLVHLALFSKTLQWVEKLPAREVVEDYEEGGKRDSL